MADGLYQIGGGFTGWETSADIQLAYSFDMFWSSICEGWNHHRPAHMWNAVFLMFASRKVIKITCSWQTLMNTCQFGSSLVGCFAIKGLVCDDISPRHGRTSSFSGFTPKHPSKTKTDLFNPVAAKALCLPETLGTAPASTNLCEVGFFRNLEVEERSWFIMWTKPRDLLILKNSKVGYIYGILWWISWIRNVAGFSWPKSFEG